MNEYQNIFTFVVTVAGESSITGSLVTDTAKYGLSMRGQAPLSLHVW